MSSGRRSTLAHMSGAAMGASNEAPAQPQPVKKRQSLIPGVPGIRRQSLASDAKAKRKARHSLGGPPISSGADAAAAHHTQDEAPAPASAASREPASQARVRRASLGGGVPAAARRKSLGGSAASAAAASGSSSGRRMSLGGGSAAALAASSGSSGLTVNFGGGRRSSLYGRGAPKDPRPVGSSEFDNQCIEKLVRFLASRQYPAVVTKKDLASSPSAVTFRNILEFLVQQIDPGFSFLMQKPPASANLTKQQLHQHQQAQQQQFEAEVPALFKRFGYPYPLGQRPLSTISPVGWPILLAALGWLVDYIEFADACAGSQYGLVHEDFDFSTHLPLPSGGAAGGATAALDCADALLSDEQDVEALNDRLFFEYSAQGYKMYLSSENPQLQPLQESAAKYFDRLSSHVRLEIDQLESGLDALRTEIDTLEACQGDLMKLETQRATLQAQVRKQQAQLAEARSQQRARAAELAGRRTTAAACAEELQELLKQQTELRAAVAGQEYRPDEVLRMRGEQNALKEALAAADRRQQELRQEISAEQAGIQEAQDGVEEVVRLFNEMALGLEMIPASAANAHDHDFELKFLDPFGGGSTTALESALLPAVALGNTASIAPLAEMTNLDLDGFVEPYLMKLRLLVQEQFTDASERLQRLSKQLAEAEFGFRDQQAKTESLRGRLDKLQTTFRQEHAALTEHLQQQVNRVQELELELHRLDDRAAALEHSEHRVQALQEQLASLRALHLQERKALEHTITLGLQRVQEHKRVISKFLRELGQAYTRNLEDDPSSNLSLQQSGLGDQLLDQSSPVSAEDQAAPAQPRQAVRVKVEPVPIRVKSEPVEQEAPTFDPFPQAVPAAVLPTLLDLSSAAALKRPGAAGPGSSADENHARAANNWR